MNNLTCFLLLIPLLLVNCTQHKPFNKSGWQEKGDLAIYPNRAAMLKDLTTHHQIKGLHYTQLIESLGEPEGFADTKPNTIYYNIVTEYGQDIDPVYIKNLIINLNSDSIVSSFGIEEIKH